MKTKLTGNDEHTAEGFCANIIFLKQRDGYD